MSEPTPQPSAPMSAPPDQSAEVDVPPAIKPTERPHPLTPFIRGWIVLVAIIIGWSRELVPDGDGEGFDASDLRWILPVLGGMVLLAGIAGFFSWYFTRFVIDDEELRVETGAIFKNSKRITFVRIQSVDIVQPFAARIFGLAELRIEVGAGDSSVRLRYLTRAKASQLRDYLMARAHGEQVSIAHASQQPAASVFTDLSAADKPLVTVGPGLLIGGFLLSSDWLITVLMVIVAFGVTTYFGVVQYALPGLLPLAIAGVSMIGRRVIAQFNFTLAESSRGLRITRGLTNLTSQSVPIDRIQGVRVGQSLLWRRFGWYRVDVDVLGFASQSSDENQTDATSILLPVATGDQVKLALTRVLPGVDLEGIELHKAPRRSRWVRPFDWWTLRYGWNEAVIITENGWLINTRNIVPHGKSQSVRVEQGPIQRRLELADLHVDTPKGPVNLVARQLTAEAAREVALSQLDRARTARRAIVVGPNPDLVSQAAVLDHFGIAGAESIGAGGESQVFALGPEHVLRLYHSGHESGSTMAEQLKSLYAGWSMINIGIEVPQIVESGEIAGRHYTVDRRMSGRDFSGWLAEAQPEERRQALLSFLDAAWALQRLPLPYGFVPHGQRAPFGRLLGDSPRCFDSLTELLNHQLDGSLAISHDQLRRDVPNFDALLENLRHDIAQRVCQPALVHGDLCAPNAFVSRKSDGSVVVSGVCDFSPHTLAADPVMDVAAAVWFLAMEKYPEASEDTLWLASIAAERLGPDGAHWLKVYRHYFAIYFSMTVTDQDQSTYAACVAQLTQ